MEGNIYSMNLHSNADINPISEGIDPVNTLSFRLKSDVRWELNENIMLDLMY